MCACVAFVCVCVGWCLPLVGILVPALGIFFKRIARASSTRRLAHSRGSRAKKCKQVCDVALRLLRINSPDSGWTLCDSIDYSRSGGGGADVLRPPAPHTHEALAKKRKQVCELAIAGINSPRLRLNLRRTLCDSGQKIPVHRATGPFALSWKLGRTLFNRAALWRHENCRSCYYNRRPPALCARPSLGPTRCHKRGICATARSNPRRPAL